MSGIFGSVTQSISKAFRGVVWGSLIIWLTMVGPVVLYLLFVIGYGLVETAKTNHCKQQASLRFKYEIEIFLSQRHQLTKKKFN